ncbi:hypothetical protein [Herbaspirillum seropedicae]|uniref:hypothetical protein n=1 Tax=Herbaspirillum seropedicae TaxID=964 RepID=UPI002864FD75|nr:hypothetical protein [Herbaspirillum seropedicae]MDR6395904.1 hypothetical protein [Herbaspirillum seropedicae]
MPRQPYLPTFKHLNFAVGALVLKDRPEHCAAIGKCLSIWGQVDNEMGNLFALLLGTESAAALEVFLSLRRSSNQREALESAAKYKLTGGDLLLFQALLSVYGSLEKERNGLAHGCFGVCPDDPSILFWIDIKDHVHFQTATLAKEIRGEFSETDDRHAHLKERLYVYRLPDLETLYLQMEEFWFSMFYFNGYLRFPNDPGRINEMQRVRQFPKIVETLQKISSRANSRSLTV